MCSVTIPRRPIPHFPTFLLPIPNFPFRSIPPSPILSSITSILFPPLFLWCPVPSPCLSLSPLPPTLPSTSPPSPSFPHLLFLPSPHSSYPLTSSSPTVQIRSPPTHEGHILSPTTSGNPKYAPPPFRPRRQRTSPVSNPRYTDSGTRVYGYIWSPEIPRFLRGE